MEPTLTTSNMRYWRMAPDPRLRPHVLCYFLARPRALVSSAAAAFSGGEGLAQDEELLLPDGHSEIVFQLGGAFERWPLGEAARRQVMKHSYVIGSRSHTVLTRDLGPVTVAGIKLDPRALRWLLGIPLTELRDSTVSLDELGQRGLVQLEEAVARAASSSDVAAVFDRYLLHALADLPPADAAVEQLLRHIRSSRGALAIMEWVHERRVDARHLERRFADAVGMTPKRLARIVRFKHGYHALLAGAAQPTSSRGPLAAPHRHLDGFYDQSHFNKEFRTFVGASPTARLRATLPQATSISDHLLAGELSSGHGAQKLSSTM
jgi:AraC-like DNA-binding protein